MKKNDSPATKKDLKEVEEKLSAKINEFDAKTDKLDVKIDRVEEKLSAKINKLDAKTDKLDVKIDRVEEKLSAKINKLDVKTDKLDVKIDRVEESLRAEIRITAKETKQDLKEEMSKNRSQIINTLDKFLKEISDSREERIVTAKRLSDCEHRVEKLEKHVFVN